jgi:hypothetical protein
MKAVTRTPRRLHYASGARSFEGARATGRKPALVALPRLPQLCSSRDDEHDSRDQSEQACVVVRQKVALDGAGHHTERAEKKSESGAADRSHAQVGSCSEGEQSERDKAAEQVIAGRRQ